MFVQSPLPFFFFLLSVQRAEATAATHHFGHRHSHIHVLGGASPRRLFRKSQELKIMHISDAHISLKDDDPPRTSRMYNAFMQTVDKVTSTPTTSAAEFVRLLEMACAKDVDLIALGGDIVNFPSNETVAWVLNRMRDAGCNKPFIYTAGNHDWHTEGLPADSQYDSQRVPHLETTLRPLFEHSLMPHSGLHGHATLKGVEILALDNSNHQINQQQLDFARSRLGPQAAGTPGPPVLLLLHMPLALPGVGLPPKESCGHARWGAAADENWELEARPRWPQGNLPSTLEFLELVRGHAAPEGRIVALLSGHVHRDFSVAARRAEGPSAANRTSLACDAGAPGCALRPGVAVLEAGGAVGAGEPLLEAEGAVQYTTLDAAEGGYRLLTIRHTASHEPPLV